MSEPTTAGQATPSRERAARPGAASGAAVAVALVALAAAVVVGRGVTRASLAGSIPSGTVADLLSYACIWVPLLAGVVVAGALWWRVGRAGGGTGPGAGAGAGAGAAAGAGSATGVGDGHGWAGMIADRLGVRILPLDLVYGIVFGLLLRFVDAAVNLGMNGVTGLAPRALLGDGPHGVDLVVLVVAPVIVSPLVEELFFRGLLQRSLAGLLAPPTGLRDARASLPSITSVVVTAALFAFLHVAIVSEAPGLALVTVISTFAFGLAAGALVAATRRLGGAVVAHIVFNAVAVWLTWPR